MNETNEALFSVIGDDSSDEEATPAGAPSSTTVLPTDSGSTADTYYITTVLTSAVVFAHQLVWSSA